MSNFLGGGGGGGGVSSVFSRTGAVTAAEGDYALAQLSDVTAKTGTGTEVPGSTTSSLVTNDFLVWNGAAWVNSVGGLPSRADNDGTVVLATTDRNSVVNVGHATANAVSIAQAGVAAANGFIGGFQTFVCTTGAGLTTITPTTSTINGASSLILAINDCARVWVPTEADTNYRAVVSRAMHTSAGYAPTADGIVGYDTTRDAFAAGGNGAVTGFFPRVLSMQNCTTSANCATTNEVDADTGQQGTTETNFASNWSMPANFLFTNKAIQVCAVFQITTSAAVPTLTMRFKAGNTVLASHYPSPTVNYDNRGFPLCYILQGTAAPSASVSVEAGYMGTYFELTANIININAQPVGAIATNGALTIQISAQWGAATTGNTIQLHQFYVMEMY